MGPFVTVVDASITDSIDLVVLMEARITREREALGALVSLSEGTGVQGSENHEVKNPTSICALGKSARGFQYA